MKVEKSLYQQAVLGILLILLAIAHPGMASTFSGTVLDSKTNGPVPHVRVSIGFTDTVTYTDDNGYFAFSAGSAVRDRYSVMKSELISIKKTSQGSMINLNHCLSVNKVKMFNLNGRCFFRADLLNSRRVIQLPEVSNGLYIIQFLAGNKTLYALRWNSINISQFVNLETFPDKKQRSAQLSGSNPVVFQHDFYYPLSINEGPSPQTIFMKPDPRAEVFDETKIGRYDFVLTTADSLSMEQNALLEEYIPAEFSYNDVSYGKVGLRYKGSSYSLPNCFEDDGTRANKPECVKISFKVKFNEFTDSLRFYKMKKLNLHSESVDPSKMHDILSYALYREMGITSPRCAFSQVFLNGVFQGLYCAVEDIDGRFTAARWPDDGDGNLYKEKWPISASPDYYKTGLVTNDHPEDSADVSRMVQFYEAINSSDPATFKSNVSPFIDFDYWLHYIAVDRVIHNTDGIMTWYVKPGWVSNHNYYYYQQTTVDGKMWLIPWDLHVTFSKKDQIVDALGIPDWNVIPQNCDTIIIWGNQTGYPAHCDKLTGLTADLLWDDFVTISERMLNTCFDVNYLQNKIDRFKDLIDPVIQNDPRVDYNGWLGQVNALRNDIVTLNSDFDDYIHKRTVVNDTDEYLKPFDGTGYLSIDKLNNFEFESVGNEDVWSSYMKASNSSIQVLHNTINPLWGTADLLYSFVYNTEPGNGMYLEWGNMILKFENPEDLTTLKQIQVNLQSDSNREFWLYIASPEYGKNNLSVQYGWWDGTLSKDSLRVFKIQTAGYPSWATGSEPDILQDVLSNATGIGFQSNPHFGADGELVASPDSGFLKIDNIRFVF